MLKLQIDEKWVKNELNGSIRVFALRYAYAGKTLHTQNSACIRMRMHKLKNRYTYARIDLYTHESSLHKRRKDHAHA